jgi:hypothetical protein
MKGTHWMIVVVVVAVTVQNSEIENFLNNWKSRNIYLFLLHQLCKELFYCKI